MTEGKGKYTQKFHPLEINEGAELNEFDFRLLMTEILNTPFMKSSVSIKEIAECCGISLNKFKRMMDERKILGKSTYQKICEYFGIESLEVLSRNYLFVPENSLQAFIYRYVNIATEIRELDSDGLRVVTEAIMRKENTGDSYIKHGERRIIYDSRFFDVYHNFCIQLAQKGVDILEKFDILGNIKLDDYWLNETGNYFYEILSKVDHNTKSLKVCVFTKNNDFFIKVVIPHEISISKTLGVWKNRIQRKNGYASFSNENGLAICKFAGRLG